MLFLIPGITIPNPARLNSVQLDSIYFLNKICFSLFISEVDILYQRSETFNVCFLFPESKLSIKQDTTKERINLFIFIQCTKENGRKNKLNLQMLKK